MANSFKQAQQEALALIREIEAEVSKLDSQLVGVASNISKTLKGVSGSANMQNQLAGFNAEMERLNKLVSKQQTQIQSLTQAKNNYNNANRADTQEIKSKIPTLNQLTKAQNSLGNAYTVLVNKQKKARDEVRRLTVEQGKNSRETRRAVAEYKKLSKQVDNANKSTQSFSRKGLASVGRGFKNLLGAFGIVGGIQIFRTIVKDVFELTKTFDGLGFALERVAGDMESAADSQRFLQDISEKFGVELIATTNRWIKFLAAAKQSGITLKDTEDIFRTMAKVSGVLGLKTDELTGIYLALEQMLSKGKVTTEELRRQLGERLPGAMGIMAQAVGVTVSELDKMLKKGEVLSAEVLPKFAKAVELAYSLENIENVQTLVAEQNRLTTAWQTFIKNVTEGDSKLKGVFGFLLVTLRESITLLDDFFGGKSVSLQKEVVAATDLLKGNLDEMAEKELMLEGISLRRQREEQKSIIEGLKIKKGVSKESILAAEEEYRQILDKLQKHELEKEAIIKSYAKDNVEQSKKDFDEQTKIYEDFLSKIRDLENQPETDLFFGKETEENIKSVFGGEEINGIIINSRESFKQALKSVEANLGDATAKWRLFKKLIEDTKVVVPGDEDDGGKTKKRPAFKIDAERKAAFELAKLQQQAEIDRFKAIAENEELIIEVRQNARERQLEEEFKMIDLISNYELDVLKEKAEYEGKTDEQIKNQSKLILQESIVDKLDLNKKYYEDLLDIVKSYNKEELKEIKAQQDLEQLVRDEKVIAKRKELEEQGVLSSEEINKELVKYKNELYVEDTKNFIKQLIAKKEAELKATDNPELQQALRRQIADLEIALANVGLKGLTKDIDNANQSVQNFLRSFTDEAMSDFGFNTLNELLTIEKNGKSVFDNLIENAKDAEEEFGIAFASITEVAQEAFNLLNSQQDAYFENQLFRLEQEKDIAIQFAGDSATAREDIELEYEERRREIQQRQAEKQREMALFNILINTAQGVVAALTSTPPNIPLSIAVGLIGGIKASLVASTPIPQFFRGTMNSPEGWAMVDEKRPEIHTDNKGNIKSFGESKANMRWMNQGDKVYTSRETFFQKELGGILEGNDILPYNQMFDMVSPIVNVESGIGKDEFRKEIRSMTSKLMSKETSIVKIDKKGFTSSVIRGNGKVHKQNNILTLKGGVV